MKIKIDQVIRNRTGEPFFDMVNGEVVEISLGGHISRILDGMSVGSVGDHRKVGRLADRFDDADGEIDLSIDDIKILQDTLKAAKAIRINVAAWGSKCCFGSSQPWPIPCLLNSNPPAWHAAATKAHKTPRTRRS